MTKPLAGTPDKSSDPTEGFLADDSDVDFDGVEEVAPVRPAPKDHTIRRKIEDRLERRRLRDELGIYDDETWDGI